MNDNNSSIKLDANTIVCENNSELLKISINDLELIGEYTNEDGPYLNDWFFVFIVAPKHEQYHVSMYSEGRDDFLSALSQHLNYQLETSLFNSAHLNSNIIWPECLEGKKLYRFEPVRSGSLWGRFLQWVSPEFHNKLTDDVCEYLNVCS